MVGSSKFTPSQNSLKLLKIISQKPFGQKSWNVQDFHFSMMQTNGENFIKFWDGVKRKFSKLGQVGMEWPLSKCRKWWRWLWNCCSKWYKVLKSIFWNIFLNSVRLKFTSFFKKTFFVQRKDYIFIHQF